MTADGASLKQQAVRGSAVVLASQGAKFVVRLASVMVMARLLPPEDFGLVGMVTIVTGFLGLFRDAGLSLATVQSAAITRPQLSTLFWINVGLGVALAGATAAAAPVLVRFYHEPRIFAVTLALATAFVFNALAAQHQALLQRRLRFVALAAVEMAALVASIVVAIVMALGGYGVWALVGQAVSGPIVGAVASFVAEPWVPGPPSRRCGTRPMLRFGGVMTVNTITMYATYNLEKLLLGRYWGAEALGLYGRAYQLINLPTDQLHGSIGTVAFSALSRLQGDPPRLGRYFLKGYSLVLSLTMPIALVSLLFADDIVRVVLGARWVEAVPTFRLLAPGVLALGVLNPFGWLLVSSGAAARSMKGGFLIAPLVLASYAVGLPFGPAGVAASFSAAMLLVAAPMVAWFRAASPVSGRDILRAVRPPVAAGLLAGAAGVPLVFAGPASAPAVLRLAIDAAIVLAVYAWALLVLMKQRGLYSDLLGQLRARRRGVGDGAVAFS